MKKILGLSSQDAVLKLKEFGFNEIKEVNKVTALQILFRQIKKNFIIYLLFITALISLFLGKPETSFVIFIVITLVVTIGFIQEYKAENAISDLKGMIMQLSRVIRDGKEQEIASTEIVPEDVLVLRAGDKIPADCVVLEQKNLRVNESVLTGESAEVKKKETSEIENASDENRLFMGTFVISGNCLAKVTHTGMNTKFGQIAELISTSEKEYPLQDKVNNISKYMVILGVLTSMITGIILFSRVEVISPQVIVEILVLVVAICVSAFPEGFPVVLIATLAAGVNRMAKQNVIVNRMSVIETLGETTIICSDKTGTLTKGEMTVQKIWANGKYFNVSGIGLEGKGEIMDKETVVDISKNKALDLLIKTGVACNDASIERTGDDDIFQILGGQTEGSLLILGAKVNLFKENFPDKRIEEIPFDTDRKMMSVGLPDNDGFMIYAKGAPESILQRSTKIQKDEVVALTDTERALIAKEFEKMTDDSLRILTLAYKKVDKNGKYSEDDLTFLGLVGIEDPPREEVKSAIEDCVNAGIKVMMITGDNSKTASAIASQIGLVGKVMEGKEIDALTDDELSKLIKEVGIFARVKPEHKLRIVKILKQNGEIVAMTGDGVNDAPALKEANIGIAMGITGTDVSRSVADLTLKDDNFATIVSAIKEGRTIFNNIRKFVTYQLSCNLAEIVILLTTVLLAPIFGWFVPVITALQILFMNLVTDNLPAITLGFNPTSKDIMRERPRNKSEIINLEFIRVIIFNGVVMGTIAISVLYFTFNILTQDVGIARTTTLIAMIFLDIFSAYNFRSFRYGVLSRSLFVNKYLAIASVVSIIATIIVVYSPLKNLFETKSIGIGNWLIAITSGLIIVLIFDILKFINNRGHKLLTIHT